MAFSDRASLSPFSYLNALTAALRMVRATAANLAFGASRGAITAIDTAPRRILAYIAQRFVPIRNASSRSSILNYFPEGTAIGPEESPRRDRMRCIRCV